MAGISWSDSVEIAVRRLAARQGVQDFTRQQLIQLELPRIVDEVGSRGATPEMTLSRELQQLRDKGIIEFVGPGSYRLLSPTVSFSSLSPSKCIFVVGDRFGADNYRFVSFPAELLPIASRSVGQWILYEERQLTGGSFFGAAQVEQIVRSPKNNDELLALIMPGTFLEFGIEVSTDILGSSVSSETVRTISDISFDKVRDHGIVSGQVPDPNTSHVQTSDRVIEAQFSWSGPVFRETVLSNRAVRDRQFRLRVLAAYGHRCAFTGIRLFNLAGRSEAQAAHVMSVGSGGPDLLANGIALSATAHWMFDNGLISLEDDGSFLMPEKLIETDSIRRLLNPDGRAHFPSASHDQPHPRFLAWHREFHSMIV